MWKRVYIKFSIDICMRLQAKVFTPSTFIAHDPQTPCAHDLLKVKDGSISFLILIRISKTLGPQLSISTSNVSTLDFCHQMDPIYKHLFLNFFEFVTSLKYLPTSIFEF